MGGKPGSEALRPGMSLDQFCRLAASPAGGTHWVSPRVGVEGSLTGERECRNEGLEPRSLITAHAVLSGAGSKLPPSSGGGYRGMAGVLGVDFAP